MIRFTLHVRPFGDAVTIAFGPDADGVEVSLRVFSWVQDTLRHAYGNLPGDYRVTYTPDWLMVDRVA